jgi:hypothetical protein
MTQAPVDHQPKYVLDSRMRHSQSHLAEQHRRPLHRRLLEAQGTEYHHRFAFDLEDHGAIAVVQLLELVQGKTALGRPVDGKLLTHRVEEDLKQTSDQRRSELEDEL